MSAWPTLNAHGFNAGNSEPESLEQRRVAGDSRQGGDQGEASEATGAQRFSQVTHSHLGEHR